MVKEIWLVSGNPKKQKEFRKIIKEKALGDIVQLYHHEDSLSELQTDTMEDLIRHKALESFRKIKRPMLVEHTSLHLKGWGDFPGGLTQVIWEQLGEKGFMKLAESNREAIARTYLGYIDGKRLNVYVGEIKGKIAEEPKGKNGFGWDRIFIPNEEQRTFGQMKSKEKNKISMRRKALEYFLQDLSDKGEI